MRYSVSSKTTIRENKQSPPGTMSAAIETHLLTRKYRRTVALNRVTLEVPEHAVYALVGANGAGKTTLIRLLMNISQNPSYSTYTFKQTEGNRYNLAPRY
jgi:ABC-type multidrug transport system ATPase subunit